MRLLIFHTIRDATTAAPGSISNRFPARYFGPREENHQKRTAPFSSKLADTIPQITGQNSVHFQGVALAVRLDLTSIKR
jgi:hypothetical protein